MRSLSTRFIFILVVLLAALWVDTHDSLKFNSPISGDLAWQRDISPKLGLDLQGGLQVVLEADLPADTTITSAEMEVARQILEKRTNGLGVNESVLQVAGARRIVGEFPGADNPDQVVASLGETGLLEFVDFGTTPLPEGTVVHTDLNHDTGAINEIVPTPTESAPPVPGATPAVDPNATPDAGSKIYHTIMTGAEIKTALVTSDPTTGKIAISFTLTSKGADIFAQHTSTHVGQALGIVLDGVVISSPNINSAITGGQGEISGGFTVDTANALAVQLRYGSLPIPFKVIQSQTVGATLGEESVRKSLLAGGIGLGVVILFMLFYYRLPGGVADLALILYALISYALFKIIPITLTLPGLAGFILSIGMAVDANILIFERMKEELRGGRTLLQAIDLGWSRAWPSIRDSNISTLITCLILFYFGNSFGASMVKGFSITLALGVFTSLFTALIVTRTFLHIILDRTNIAEHPRWFGL